MRAFFIILLFIFLLGGIVYLQIFLSKKENKFLGLIFPAIIFVFSVIFSFGVTPLTTTQKVSVQTTTEENIITFENSTATSSKIKNSSIYYYNMILLFLLYNTYTILLLVIYFSYRKKKTLASNLIKMRANDLQ